MGPLMITTVEAPPAGTPVHRGKSLCQGKGRSPVCAGTHSAGVIECYPQRRRATTGNLKQEKTTGVFHFLSLTCENSGLGSPVYALSQHRSPVYAQTVSQLHNCLEVPRSPVYAQHYPPLRTRRASMAGRPFMRSSDPWSPVYAHTPCSNRYKPPPTGQPEKPEARPHGRSPAVFGCLKGTPRGHPFMRSQDRRPEHATGHGKLQCTAVLLLP